MKYTYVYLCHFFLSILSADHSLHFLQIWSNKEAAQSLSTSSLSLNTSGSRTS